MPSASSFSRAIGLKIAALGLVVFAGCTEEKAAPPPNITVIQAPPQKPGRPTDAGPGSSAATDSTLRH